MPKQGPRSKFSSEGAKEECVKENFFVKLFFVSFIFTLAKKWGAKAPPAPPSALSLPKHITDQHKVL